MIALLVALASAAEFRRIELADGRVLQVEVVASGAAGLDLRLPYGRLSVPFESVASISEIDESAYRSQAPLRVLLLPPLGPEALAAAVDTGLHAELAAFAGQGVVDLLGEGTPLPVAQRSAALACGGAVEMRIACVRSAIDARSADLILVPLVAAATAGAAVTLTGEWMAWPTAHASVTRSIPLTGASSNAALAEALHLALGVTPPAVAPVASTTPPPPDAVPVSPPKATEPPPRPRAVSPALAFVPIPGFPQWIAGDPGHAALATAVVVPGTVAAVLLSGAASSRPSEVVGLSLLGYYSLCVTTSQAWLPVVAPTSGGVTIGAAGRF